MKRKELFTMLFATLAFAACGSDDEMTTTADNGDRQPILLSGSVSSTSSSATRTASLNLQAEQILAGSGNVRVHVYYNPNTYISDDGYGFEGILFSADGLGGLTLTEKTPAQPKPFYPANAKPVDIYAWSPADILTVGTRFADAVEVGVKADQTTDANYIASDLLYGNRLNQAKSKQTEEITFSHRFAKVIINLSADPGYGVTTADLQKATIELTNVRLSRPFSLKDGSFPGLADDDPTASGVTLSSVKLKAATQTDLDVTACVPPQKVKKGTYLFSIKYVNADFIYIYDGDTDLVFEPSKVYTFDVKVRSVGITVTSSITDWATGTSVDDGKAKFIL